MQKFQRIMAETVSMQFSDKEIVLHAIKCLRKIREDSPNLSSLWHFQSASPQNLFPGPIYLMLGKNCDREL